MKNSEFKYLLIGVMILAWGVVSYQRNQKRKTERAEILDDLNSYVNGWIKFAAIQKAIVQNGKGWWISKENYLDYSKKLPNKNINPLSQTQDWVLQFAGNDTNEKFPPTVEDIKNSKAVLIGVTEGASFGAEMNKYPGYGDINEFWKEVNKNHFYLNRLMFLEKNPGISGKMYRKSTLRSIANNYKDLSLNKATEILLNKKKIQDFPG